MIRIASRPYRPTRGNCRLRSASGARRSAPSSPSAASRTRAPRSGAPARGRCRTAATAPPAWSDCPSAAARSGCAARARSASSARRSAGPCGRSAPRGRRSRFPGFRSRRPASPATRLRCPARTGAFRLWSGAARRRFMLTTSCSGTSSTRAIFATCSGCRSPSSIACIWPFSRRRLKNSFFCAAVVPIFTSDQVVQDVFLDRGADPPHRIGGQAEAAVRVEPLDRLHHADIALADQFADRQAVAAIAHGDFRHEPQM